MKFLSGNNCFLNVILLCVCVCVDSEGALHYDKRYLFEFFVLNRLNEIYINDFLLLIMIGTELNGTQEKKNTNKKQINHQRLICNKNQHFYSAKTGDSAALSMHRKNSI